MTKFFSPSDRTTAGTSHACIGLCTDSRRAAALAPSVCSDKRQSMAVGGGTGRRSRRVAFKRRVVWLLAAAGALLFIRRALRIYSLLQPSQAGPLALPARWPDCTPDRAGTPRRTGGAREDADVPTRAAVAGRRYAIVSTWPPTHCGIATYSSGLREGLLVHGAALVDVLAVHLRGSSAFSYGSEVLSVACAVLPRRSL